MEELRNYYKLRNLKYEESYDKIVDEEKSMRERKKKILSRIIKLNEYETAIETRTQPPRRGIDQFFKNVTVGTVVTDTIDPLR